MSAAASLVAGAVTVMGVGEAAAKAETAIALYALGASDHAPPVRMKGDPAPPDRPARPDKPVLAAPKHVPRRRLGTPAGRIAMLHAVAHIELNAIDLACDMAARFAGDGDLDDADRVDFVRDWLSVAADEGRHFLLLADRLADYGAAYGDLPAHDGLWTAAQDTAHDIAARLAVAPLVLEARGLDVTPDLITKLEAVNDGASAACLRRIYDEEVRHVALGSHWLKKIAARRGCDPDILFRQQVADCFSGSVKPPFNIDARWRAGLPHDWYAPLAGVDSDM